MSQMSQRILVVDDDKSIVRLLRAYLEKSGYQVVAAHDGRAALRLLRQSSPDLMVLDLMLPDIDGWEITRIVRGDDSLKHIPIIMLTARVEDTDKIVGLELGGDDYLTKPFNPQVIVAHVRAVLRRIGNAEMQPMVLRLRELELDVNKHALTVAGEAVELTPTEFDFLEVLLSHPDRVFTRLELIESALGYSYEGLERTVDSHIKNLRRKIEPDPRNPTYIVTVYGVGYRMQGAS